MKRPIISLCMPTNGIIEWVFPVLDSIYNQKVDEELFEVVVTNNGDNEVFDSLMCKYARGHSNLVYKKTNAYMFYNQLETLKLASGSFLKLINHRGVFVEGALIKMINIISTNKDTMPVIFFGNGVYRDDRYVLDNFDDFVCSLGRYASWTTGVGIWREDYLKIPKDVKIDKISPHSCILFSERKKNNYLIENFLFSQDVDNDQSKKGKYDLFKAFAVEEVMITLNLYIDGDITSKTFKAVKNDYKKFVAELYWRHVIKKVFCSYDLSGFDDAMGIFFSYREIKIEILKIGISKIIKRIKKIGRK